MIFNLNKILKDEVVKRNPKFQKVFLNDFQLKSDVIVIVHNGYGITRFVPGYVTGNYITIKDNDVTEKIIIRNEFKEFKGIKFTAVTFNYRKDRELTGRKYKPFTDWF